MTKLLFEFTNEQRKYLGLAPVEKHWELVRLSDMYLYFDGDTIRKKITVDNEDWIFKAWVNNGTSVDRIITISKDSLYGNSSCITEVGILYKKRLFREKKEMLYNKIRVEPKSGYVKFFQTIDSLDLENYETQKNFDYILDHRPTSLYIIEIKNGDKHHQFSFKTYFPMSLTIPERKVDEKYEFIENLLFDEFGYLFYMK